jgi:hypothetical protein
VNGIAVENVQKLPYEAISNEPIRDAAAAYSAARAAADEAKKTHVQLEQELPNAHQEDAAADERLRAEGKPKLKGRPATQAAERGVADAAHEHRVAELALTRARGALEAALAEHGQAWADELTTSVEAMCVEWGNSVEGLIALHAQLAGALSVARRVMQTAELPRIAALGFERRAVEGVEFASPQPRRPAFIQTTTVLDALARAIKVEPDVEPEPVVHPPWKGTGSLNRGQANVDEEIEQRRAFDRYAESPEGIAERDRVIAERRRRRERHGQAGQEAREQELAG